MPAIATPIHAISPSSTASRIIKLEKEMKKAIHHTHPSHPRSALRKPAHSMSSEVATPTSPPHSPNSSPNTYECIKNYGHADTCSNSYASAYSPVESAEDSDAEMADVSDSEIASPAENPKSPPVTPTSSPKHKRTTRGVSFSDEVTVHTIERRDVVVVEELPVDMLRVGSGWFLTKRKTKKRDGEEKRGRGCEDVFRTL